MSRHKPLSNASSNFTPIQLWIMVKANRRICLLAGFVAALISLSSGLFEIPYYESYSKIQFKSFDMGKTVTQATLQDSDTLGIRDVMDRAISLLRSDSFRAELASVIKQNHQDQRLVLAWAVGYRRHIQAAMNRIGLVETKAETINLQNLSEEEIAALLERMIDIQPDYKEQSETIKVTALEPFTAQKVNDFVSTALINADEKIKSAEIQKSIAYLDHQRDAASARLVEANDNLRMFYADNPDLAGSANRANVADEKSDLQAKKDKIQEEIESNRKLLSFYMQKYQSFSRESDMTAEVYNKFKQELIELKYKRKKFLFEGYDEKNEGILELDAKIKNLEKNLSSSAKENRAAPALNMVGISHDENLSEKIMELQESIKRSEFEAESYDKRIKKLTPQTSALSKSMLLLDNLRSEVRMATELFEDLSKKAEYAKMRKGGDGQLMSRIESPSLPAAPINIPIAMRMFFSFFVGIALAVSGLILNMIFSAKITDWQSVEDLGINFAGHLRDYDPDLSEILLNLDCLDKDSSEATQIVLCTSPNQYVGYDDLILMSNFLARQNEKSLLVLVGNAEVHSRYELLNDVGFAKIFAHRNGKEYLLQISDKNTIKLLRESIEILETNYGLKYSCVFLFFSDGIHDPSYHVGIKLASKVLLLGIPAMFSGAEYMKLLSGLKEINHAHVCFVEVRRRKSLRSRSYRATPAEFEEIVPKPFVEKIKGTFFEQ